ncbi:DNA primase [Roseiarcus fermentans]|uniref:DNA primase n=1 Tax=Roseiarcus fermentans TaxID=1473586 RepID=A0A366FU62_9HYPH|nr:DNA primase [Roseiarcus fermentans]RBP18061.1 DNA primase [Roseiarcus fermentans]
MKFPPEFLDEIRARLPVSEVVARRVKLRKQGREWAGLSPFNAEKTPSFFVNDQKGFYHDFSSGKHGDVFRFLMETEGLSFPDAVERLAGVAGVPMPRMDRAEAERETKRASLLDVLAMAARLFEANLQGSAGAKARGYLSDRGLGPAVQERFSLGYAAPDRFALRDALAAKGVGADQMIEAGLLIHGEGIAVPYDRFRDRVMFPIHDRNGKVVAFGGRALEPGAKAKYLNSPETQLFHKGSLLFNHHRARKSAHDAGALVAVEGYVDTIAMSEAGFPHVVAPLGTALTADQCALLWTMADEPILCFDGDNAGRKAAFRAVETALPLIGAAKSLRFALLPEGQDPDDLIRSSGPTAIAEALCGARSFADMLFLRELDDRPLDTPERRAGLERRLAEAVGGIADETLRRHYLADMKRRLAALFGEDRPGPGAANPRRTGGEGRGKGFPPRGPRIGVAETPLPPHERLVRKAPEPAREIAILALALGHPSLLEAHWEALASLEFVAPRLAAFRDALLAQPVEALDSPDALAQALTAAGRGDERARILAEASRSPTWWCLRAEAATTDAEHVLRQSLALHRRTGALNRELKLAERSLADEPNEQNFARLLDIKASLADLAHAEAAIEGFGDLSGRHSPSV